MRFILDPFSSLLSLVPIVASLARTPSFAHHKLVAASLRSAPFAGTELSHSASVTGGSTRGATTAPFAPPPGVAGGTGPEEVPAREALASGL